jgi:hypothetical protein
VHVCLVFEWIAINEAALIDHCNGKIDGGGLIERLQPLPTTLGGTGAVNRTGTIQTATPPKKL